jgi:hypothetical protein
MHQNWRECNSAGRQRRDTPFLSDSVTCYLAPVNAALAEQKKAKNLIEFLVKKAKQTEDVLLTIARTEHCKNVPVDGMRLG